VDLNPQLLTLNPPATNTVAAVLTNFLPLFCTNSGYATREAVPTNTVAVVLTSFIPVIYTNQVQMPVTNLVAQPEVLAAIDATGSVMNTFAPGIGSIVALAFGGLYHGYRQSELPSQKRFGNKIQLSSLAHAVGRMPDFRQRPVS
jgi:hypothetical protein